jgi:phosphatidylglycerophosphate synthase
LIGSKIGHSLDPLILWVYHLLFGSRVVSPNVLTILGLFFSFLASLFIALRWPLFVAGILLLLSGFCDLLDGAVARQARMETPFGGFLDSVLDRYSDLLVMLGVSVYFLRLDYPDPLFSMVSFFAAIGVAITPYARARAEASSIRCRNGFLERPERIILLVVGLIVGILRPVVVILAILTHVTVFQRVLVAKRETEGPHSQ